MRLGEEPKGIMASGFVTTLPFLSRHWSGEDKLVHRVTINFETILNPDKEPLLNLDLLRQGTLAKVNWTPQSSGIEITSEATDELEAVWFDFLTTQKIKHNPCIDHYGLSCSVCEFNFQDTYGEIGKDFIHVHHLHQIAEIGKEYKIEPIRDLRPVCPNCHAMLHKRKQPYTIEELKEMMK